MLIKGEDHDTGVLRTMGRFVAGLYAPFRCIQDASAWIHYSTQWERKQIQRQATDSRL